MMVILEAGATLLLEINSTLKPDHTDVAAFFHRLYTFAASWFHNRCLQ